MDINYTNLDSKGIKSDIESKMIQDEVMQNFPDSSMGKMVINHVASVVDLANYNLERVAEEVFDPKNRSSAIAKARGFNYSVRRNTPTVVGVSLMMDEGMIVKTNGAVSPGAANDFITFPRFTKVTINGNQFVTLEPFIRKVPQNSFKGTNIFNSLVRTISDSSWQLMTDAEISANKASIIAMKPIRLYQGEVKEFSFAPIVSATTGNAEGASIRYQVYKLPDAEFSDLFGIGDIATDSSGLIHTDKCVTQVSVSTSSDKFSPDTLYLVDRNSFVSHQAIYNKSFESQEEIVLPKVCVIRSAADGGVDLIFGDPSVVQVPTAGQIISIRYLRTKGSKANSQNVKGRDFKSSDDIMMYSFNGNEVTNVSGAFKFRATTHAVGGLDIESVDEIKSNLSGYVSSGDRLVTRQDYSTFLKSMTYPVNVRSSIVFGEQEYNKLAGIKINTIDGVKSKMRNVVAFSLIGSLYNINNSGISKPRPLYMSNMEASDYSMSLNSQLLDGEEYDKLSQTAYYYLFSKNDLLSFRTQKEYSNLVLDYQTNPSIIQYNNEYFSNVINDYNYDNNHPIVKVYNILNNRGMINVNHVYLSPFIQKFTIEGEVIVNDYADINEIERKINNSIYSHLNSNTDFQSKIYKSSIEEIINADKNVLYSNIEFKPVSDYPTLTSSKLFSAIESEYDCAAIASAHNELFTQLFTIQKNDQCLPREFPLEFKQIKDDIAKLKNDSLKTLTAEELNETRHIIGGIYDSQTFVKTNGKKVSNEITILVHRTNGYLGSNGLFPDTSDWLDVRKTLIGSLIKAKFFKKGTNEQKDVLGTITYAEPSKVVVGQNGYTKETIKQIISSSYVSGYKDINVNALVDGDVLYNDDLWLCNITFSPDDLYNQLGYPYFVDTDFEDINFIQSVNYFDESSYENVGGFCKYFLGFCPEKYITNAITNALKKLYMELHGITLCGSCNDITTYEVVNSYGTCKSCACSPSTYMNKYGTDETNADSFVTTSDAMSTLISQQNQLNANYQNKSWSSEQLQKGEADFQESFDLKEFFGITVPRDVLVMWNDEMAKATQLEPFYLEKKIHQRISVTERWFYERLVTSIIEELRKNYLDVDGGKYKVFNKDGSGNIVPTQSVTKNMIDDEFDAFKKFLEFWNSSKSVLADLPNLALATDADKTAAYTKATALYSQMKPVLEDVYRSVSQTASKENIESFMNSNAFLNIIFKLHQAFSEGIRSCMMDKYGNIVKYSMPNEIVQMTSKLVFRKRV